MSTIAVLGTFDTKAEELRFVAQTIARRGYSTLLIDVGTGPVSTRDVDISAREVAAAAGIDLPKLQTANDRGDCVAAMVEAAPRLMTGLARDGRINGIISLGGGGGTAVGTAAMRALPIGFPKVMVSTLAGGNTSAYVGTTDIVMFPSVVDLAGLNRISRRLLTQAAGAICGMVEASAQPAADETDRPIIVASMFGNTTGCVTEAKRILEQAGYQVLVFHATGVGGRTMESLIDSGMAVGVLDITTTEWADELVGGILTAGPHRLEAAARHGVPAVVTPGCMDMVNFGEPRTVPEKFRGRLFYQHNPQVTLMRTTADECEQLGRVLAEKVNQSTGPCTVLLPLRGVSALASPGGAFHDPVADEALFSAIRETVQPPVQLVELDCTINSPEFARGCAETLLKLIPQKEMPRTS